MEPDGLAHLRHELRTPLNHVIGYSEMLLEEGELEDGLGEELRQLRLEAGQLLSLVNEVLGPGRATDQTLAQLAVVAAPPVGRVLAAARSLAVRPVQGSAAGDLARIAAAAERLAQLIRDGVAPTAPAAAPVAPRPLPDVGPAPSARSPGVIGGPATILVVDDNAENRDMLARRLTRDGHRVRTASGGQEALAALAAAPADLVLLDVMMPDLNGYRCSGA